MSLATDGIHGVQRPRHRFSKPVHERQDLVDIRLGDGSCGQVPFESDRLSDALRHVVIEACLLQHCFPDTSPPHFLRP